jgi:ribosomal protein S18 acetylase RimI-like enzyme
LKSAKPLLFTVRRAKPNDAERVGDLFDAYRVFYHQRSDRESARAFVRERLERDESTIFLAENPEGGVVGFVQLYPTFSSTSTPPGRLWVLNDLYVIESARMHGIGRALLERAERLARETDAVGITLSTAIDNLRAQRLYEAMGYRRETVFFVYNRTLI